MALDDLVPCFYTGQNHRIEEPAEVLPRREVRELKRQKLGKFIESGRIFLFFKVLARKAKQLWDGPLGIGNALPFFKVLNPLLQPTKLHYETPHAGDKGIFARHYRKFIRVSARSRHSQQFIAEAIRPLAPARLAGSF